jgi:flagellar hook-length control protein FliK
MNFAMNSTMTTTTMQTAGNVAGNPAPAAATAIPGAAIPDALVPATGMAGTAAPGQALATTTAVATAPAAALPFGHWIALDRALPDVTVTTPQEDGVAAPGADAGEAQAPVEDDVVPDILLGAMAPMLAPAALPAMMLAMQVAKPAVAGDAATAPSDDAAGGPVAGAPGAVTQVTGARAAPAQAPLLPAAAAAIPPSAARTAGIVAAARPDQGAAQPVAAQPNAVPAVAPAFAPAVAPAAAPVSGEATVAAAAAADIGADTGADAVPVAPGPGALASTPPASVRSADSLVLAGPPTAWRQNLHEALGERLQLQLGRNIDQATIRLEPPMLGRIDIAIRHSGGNLEIHIAASNSDVLRQLNAVSDSLRSDLAGRQYSSVSVNVTDVPRMQASTQAGGQTPGQGQGQGDAQGRSRQEQEQARTPGRALHDEAAAGTTLFSMN